MKHQNIILVNVFIIYINMRTAAFPLSDNKVKSSKEVQGELVTGINMNGAGDATTTNNFYSINSVNKTITNTNIAQDNIHELKSRKLPVIEESSLDIGNNASGFRNKTALNNDTNNTGAINSFTFYVTVTNSSKDGVSHIKDDTGQANAEVAKKDFQVSKPEKSYNKEAITNKQKETTKLTTALKTSAEKGIDSNKLSTNMDVISIENPITDLRNSTLDEEETSKDILIGQDEEVSRDLVLIYTEDSGVQPEEPTSRIVVTVMKRSGRYWEPWELNHNVCPPSLCTASEENRPKGTGDSNILSNLSKRNMYPNRPHPGGSVFYNGDIVLDSDYENQIYGNSLRIRWKRATSKEKKRLWKDAVVPFTFSDILPQSKRVIKKAMQHIEKHTCIRFRRKKLRDEDYIRFISEPGCWSMVGRVGGEQKLSIGRGCERLGTAIHEISHSLGFWHEQARPDRDKYVKILEENISPRYLPDFAVNNKTIISSRGFPYDYESVMHYSKKAFTNLGEDTIKVIGIGKKLKMSIGQRDELSNLDIAQLRDMYKCNDKEDENVTFCPSGWKKNGRSCYKFITDLKYQFATAARHCEKLNSHLLYIESSKEDAFVKRRAKKKYPDVTVWRTGGRKFQDGFAWFTGDGQKPKKMEFTKWKKGHPSGFSSMALVHNKTADRVRWEGVWMGSASQYPEHAYPFICERRARRKCIKGKYADGRDYRGKLDHTIEGITCQKWSSQYPHQHKLLPYPFRDTGEQTKDGLGDHNYCRNPAKNRKRRPWCFTDKKKFKWQYCDVSICSKPLSDNNQNKKGSSISRNLNAKDQTNKKDAYKSNKINPGRKDTNKKNNEIQRDESGRAVKKDQNKISSNTKRKDSADQRKVSNEKSNSNRQKNYKAALSNKGGKGQLNTRNESPRRNSDTRQISNSRSNRNDKTNSRNPGYRRRSNRKRGN